MTSLAPTDLIAPNLKVAIVHYWLIRRGGAERVVEELAAMFPQADIFTLLATPEGIPPSLAGRNITTSYLQRWPGSRRFHRFLMPFFPMALESLDLSGYDLVISSEAGPAKGALTGADTLHICYCHSPMRYIWEMPHHYRASAPGGWAGRTIFSLMCHYLRIWDCCTAARVDHFIANSDNTARRLQKTYRRTSTVIRPPVDVARFSLDPERSPDDFYLVVSRLVSYKRIDLAIGACNELGRRLIIIGEGEQRRALERIAGPTISFMGKLSDQEVERYLAKCRGFLFPGEEDFGLAPIEAQASGRPVIAYGRGGALETVRPLQPNASVLNATGVFFLEPSVPALVEAILAFEAVGAGWSPDRIRAHAEQFDLVHFRARFRDFINATLGKPRSMASGA